MEGLQEVIEKIEELLEGLKREQKEEVYWMDPKFNVDPPTPCYGFSCFCCWKSCPELNPWKPQVIYTYATDGESANRASYSISRDTITTNPNITITYTAGDTK